MWRLFLVAALSAALMACQTTGPIDETSYAARIPKGSTLVLTRDIEVAPGRAGISFQDGKVFKGRADPNQPSCELRTGVLSTEDEPVVVKADTFTTGAVGRYKDPRQLFRTAEQLLASDRIKFVTKIPVDSPRQPTIRYMYCQVTGVSMWTTHLTIADIRAALGDVFELQISSN